jgi:hypothetical protein
MLESVGEVAADAEAEGHLMSAAVHVKICGPLVEIVDVAPWNSRLGSQRAKSGDGEERQRSAGAGQGCREHRGHCRACDFVAITAVAELQFSDDAVVVAHQAY